MEDILREILNGIGELPAALSSFIRKTILDDFKKKGAVIGVSGGIDSAVALSLCVRALGKENVIALLLPEKESSPSSLELGLKLIRSHGVEFEEISITPIVESCGVYEKKYALIRKMFPFFNPNIHKTSLFLPRDVLKEGSLNIPYLKIVKDGTTLAEKRLQARDYLEVMSLQNVKQRSRMLVSYMVAEKNNYVVCGTTNKTELLTGYFVKYGDGGVDIEPLADCYKTQIYGIADLLGIDRDVVTRPPSPDTWSNYISDMDFYWRMPYEVLDAILYAQEKNFTTDRIEKSLGLSRGQIQKAIKHINSMRNSAKFLSSAPPIYYLSGS